MFTREQKADEQKPSMKTSETFRSGNVEGAALPPAAAPAAAPVAKEYAIVYAGPHYGARHLVLSRTLGAVRVYHAPTGHTLTVNPCDCETL
jgi:hypothetical protein